MRRIVLLAVLVGSVPFLTAGNCLGLCDYEADPSCEDPTRAQVTGTISVPEAGGAMVGLRRIDGALAQALKDAMREEIEKLPAVEGIAPKKIKRRPHNSNNNYVSKGKTLQERFRGGEVIVKAREPMRDRKAELAAALEQYLAEAGFPIDVDVDVRLCGTEYRCLADVKFQSKPLGLIETAEAATLLSQAPFLEWAEKNLILQMAAQPNDEFFTLQWHYAAIDLPAAWDITVGSDDVTAAVIDTGVLIAHPDLEARVVSLGADLIDDPGVANDGDGRDNDGNDDGDNACGSGCHSFHGSHVAGTMGAATDNGSMVAGVTWAGRLVPVRVLGAGGGSLADIADGIEWAVGNSVDGVDDNPFPADVINMSLGGIGQSAAMDDAIDDAVAAGAIVVVAAGNDNINADEFTPANSPNAITIASHGNTGPSRSRPRKASYSNFGATVDAAAPGGEQAEDIDNDGQGDGVLSTVEDFVSFYQGTSMAAPHVAGVAMLLKSVNPNLTQEEVRDILVNSASSDLDCPEGCGAGRVSAAAALLEAQGGLDGPHVIASPAFLRVGLEQFGTPVGFKNIGNQDATVDFTIGGQDRSKCSIDENSASVGAGQTIVLEVTIERNEAGDDSGECTITADFGDQSAEARVVWTPDQVVPLQTVDVGAVRIEGDAFRVERIVTTSAIERFEYKLYNLTPGTYLIIGLVDVNNNGSYDDPEDAVGIFFPPGDGDDELCIEQGCGRVELAAGQTFANADFVVAPGFVGDDGGGGGGTGDGDLGDPCEGSQDCGGGLYCEGSLPGGYCTTDCAGDTDCPDQGLCFSLVRATGEEYQACLKSCDVDADCGRADYICDVDFTCFPS